MRISPAFSSLAAAVLGLLLLTPAALAADGERTPLNLADPESPGAQAAGSSSGSLVRTIVGLAIVLGVIYGLYWVLKQIKASRDEQATGTGLQALATLPLGANRSLQLVRAGQEVVLVGVADHSVTPIRTDGENEARALGLLVEEEVPASAADAVPRTRGFSLPLEQLRRRTARTPSSSCC
jgi:flagellar protein FliO/FliZ